MKAISFSQSSIKMYMFTIGIEELLAESAICTYDATTDEGYQRPPIAAHYKKIADYYSKEREPIVPSAILAAISPDECDYCEETLELRLKSKMRIVDGQHRIEGLKQLRRMNIETYDRLCSNLEFPVILMLIGEKDESVEIDAFININSKGRRVKTDLAEALKAKEKRKDLLVEGQLALDDEAVDMIAADIVKKLNSNPNCFWHKLIIQADEYGNRTKQPIAGLTFRRAVSPIVRRYSSCHKLYELDEQTRNTIVSDVYETIVDIWDVVRRRWPECFYNGNSYDSSYNICKGLGVVPLLRIYEDVCDKANALDEFSRILQMSKVVSEDWLVGGTFTGLASAQGFRMIKSYIMNEISKSAFLKE